MATTLYLRDTSAPVRPPGMPPATSTVWTPDGAGGFSDYWPKALSTSAGALAQTQVVGVPTGPITAPGKTSGGFWVSSPVQDQVTITGTVAVDLWAFESAMTTNATEIALVWVYRAVGGTVDFIGQTTDLTELGTTTAQRSLTFTPNPTTLYPGDVILLARYADDASGATANTGSITQQFNGAEGATGDSQIRFTETINFITTTPPTGTTLYPRTSIQGTVPDSTTENFLALSTSAPGSNEIDAWSATRTSNAADPAVANAGLIGAWISEPLAPTTFSGFLRATVYVDSTDSSNTITVGAKVYKTNYFGEARVQIGEARAAFNVNTTVSVVPFDINVGGDIGAGDRLLVEFIATGGYGTYVSNYTLDVNVGWTGANMTKIVLPSNSSVADWLGFDALLPGRPKNPPRGFPGPVLQPLVYPDAPTAVTSDVNVNPDNAAGTGAADDASIQTQVNADSAAGTGAADQAIGQVGATADNAAGTGAANDASVQTQVNAATATATGAADQAIGQVGATADNAAGTGAAGAASVALGLNAEVASGTGTAPDAAASIAVGADTAPGTGTADQAIGQVGATADNAASTGTADQPYVQVAVSADVASATGSADDAIGQVRPQADAAAGTGTADQPFVQVFVYADTATGTGTADQPSVALTVNADAASGTGSADQPGALIGAQADAAAGTGSADDASIALSVNPDTASGTGTADDATMVTIIPAALPGTPPVWLRPRSFPGPHLVTFPNDATPQTGAAVDFVVEAAATGTGTADDPYVQVFVYADTASGTGSADQPGALIGAQPDTAAGTGAAPDPSVALTVNADAAAATGTADQAIGQVGPAPDVAAATGTASDAAVALGLQSDTASGTGTADQPSTALGLQPDTAAGTGTALDPNALIGLQPATAAGTGTALDPSIAAAVTADTATGAGSADDATALVGTQPDTASGTGSADQSSAALGVAAATATGSSTSTDPTVLVSVNPDTASGTGTADDPTVIEQDRLDSVPPKPSPRSRPRGFPGPRLEPRLLWDASAVVVTNFVVEAAATGVGTADDAAIALALNAVDTATATGTAGDPTAQVGATADAAGATGTAETPYPQVFVYADCATGSATAPDASPATQARPDTAAATGTASDPYASVAAAVDAALATAIAADPVLAVGMAADEALATAVALDPSLALIFTADTAYAVGTAPDPTVRTIVYTFDLVDVGRSRPVDNDIGRARGDDAAPDRARPQTGIGRSRPLP